MVDSKMTPRFLTQDAYVIKELPTPAEMVLMPNSAAANARIVALFLSNLYPKVNKDCNKPNERSCSQESEAA